MEFKNLKNGVIEIFNELIKRGKVRSNRDFFAPIGVSDSVGSGILSSNSDRTLPKKKIQDLVNTWNVCETFLQNGQHPIFRSDGLNSNTLNDEENKALIPMYNAPAAAGGIEVYADTESGKVVGHISFPGITKGSYALQVYGTSMHPTLGSGAWVILRPIEAAQDIVWGEVYYIEWSSYRMFKRLLKGDTEDEVILWSDNQEEKIYDRPKHAPIHIKKEDIRKLSLMTDMYVKANH